MGFAPLRKRGFGVAKQLDPPRHFLLRGGHGGLMRQIPFVGLSQIFPRLGQLLIEGGHGGDPLRVIQMALEIPDPLLHFARDGIAHIELAAVLAVHQCRENFPVFLQRVPQRSEIPGQQSGELLQIRIGDQHGLLQLRGGAGPAHQIGQHPADFSAPLHRLLIGPGRGGQGFQ